MLIYRIITLSCVVYVGLAVLEIYEQKRPIWLLSPSILQLECKGGDASGQQIEWFKDEEKLDPQNDQRINMRWAGGTSSLNISNTDGKDSGQYRCSQGAAHAEAPVKVLDVTVYNGKYTKGESVTIGVSIDNLSAKEIEHNVSFTWKKNGTEDLEFKDDKHEYDSKKNNVTFLKPTIKDIGSYESEFRLNVKEDGRDRKKILSQSVYIFAKPSIKESYKSKNLVEGDTLTLECEAYGYPTPEITWYRGETLLTAGNRTTIKDLDKDDKTGHIFVKNGMLLIKDLTFDDRNNYTCDASNKFGSDNYTVSLRVKDKLAALWPFLAIVAEVVILCVIIFIYEKKKGKELEEQAASAHLNGKHSEYGDVPRDKKPSKEDVRLRKT